MFARLVIRRILVFKYSVNTQQWDATLFWGSLSSIWRLNPSLLDLTTCHKVSSSCVFATELNFSKSKLESISLVDSCFFNSRVPGYFQFLDCLVRYSSISIDLGAYHEMWTLHKSYSFRRKTSWWLAYWSWWILLLSFSWWWWATWSELKMSRFDIGVDRWW